MYCYRINILVTYYLLHSFLLLFSFQNEHSWITRTNLNHEVTYGGIETATLRAQWVYRGDLYHLDIRAVYLHVYNIGQKKCSFLTSGAIYRLVPTLLVVGTSTESLDTLCRTANPRSPITQDRLLFTKIFLDFRSLWAMAGLPGYC